MEMYLARQRQVLPFRPSRWFHGLLLKHSLLGERTSTPAAVRPCLPGALFPTVQPCASLPDELPISILIALSSDDMGSTGKRAPKFSSRIPCTLPGVSRPKQGPLLLLCGCPSWAGRGWYSRTFSLARSAAEEKSASKSVMGPLVDSMGQCRSAGGVDGAWALASPLYCRVTAEGGPKLDTPATGQIQWSNLENR
jgi:hypothetical protein